MSQENAEVQENDTEMTTNDLAAEAFDELEAANEPIVEAEQPEVAEAVEETAEQVEEKPEEQHELVVEAPQEWNQQLKEAFETLPTPEAKKALKDAHMNMYKDYQADKQALAPIKATAEMVMKHVSPLEGELRMRGQSTQQYIDTIFATADGLNTDPHKTLAYLNQIYDYKPETPQADDTWVSPEQEEITALKAELDAIKQGQQQFQTQQEQQQQQQFFDAQKSAQDHAERQFREAINPDGTPAHPHFSDPEVYRLTNLFADQEAARLQQQKQEAVQRGETFQPLTETQVKELTEKCYQMAVRATGKDAAEKPKAAIQPRIKSTPPSNTEPPMTTAQIAAAEWEKMANS